MPLDNPFQDPDACGGREVVSPEYSATTPRRTDGYKTGQPEFRLSNFLFAATTTTCAIRPPGCRLSSVNLESEARGARGLCPRLPPGLHKGRLLSMQNKIWVRSVKAAASTNREVYAMGGRNSFPENRRMCHRPGSFFHPTNWVRFAKRPITPL